MARTQALESATTRSQPPEGIAVIRNPATASCRRSAPRDFQWAAELADCLLAVDGANVEAKRLKAQALTELGERQTSANARNYYLSVAQYLLRDLPP